jgi:hypothetical protein
MRLSVCGTITRCDNAGPRDNELSTGYWRLNGRSVRGSPTISVPATANSLSPAPVHPRSRLPSWPLRAGEPAAGTHRQVLPQGALVGLSPVVMFRGSRQPEPSFGRCQIRTLASRLARSTGGRGLCGRPRPSGRAKWKASEVQPRFSRQSGCRIQLQPSGYRGS